MAYKSYTTGADDRMASAVDQANSGLRFNDPEMDMFTAAQSTQGLLPEMMELQRITESRSRLNAGNMARRQAISNDLAAQEDENVFESFMNEMGALEGVSSGVERAEMLDQIQRSNPNFLRNKDVQESLRALRESNNNVTIAARSAYEKADAESKHEQLEATKDLRDQTAITDAQAKLLAAKTNYNKLNEINQVEGDAYHSQALDFLSQSSLPDEQYELLSSLASVIGDSPENRGDLRIFTNLTGAIDSASNVDESFDPILSTYTDIEKRLQAAKLNPADLLGDVTPELKAKLGRTFRSPEEVSRVISYASVLRDKSKALNLKDDMIDKAMGAIDPETGERSGGLIERMKQAYLAGDKNAYNDARGSLDALARRAAGKNRRAVSDRERSLNTAQENLKVKAIITEIQNKESLIKARSANAKASVLYQAMKGRQLAASSADSLIKSMMSAGLFGEGQVSTGDIEKVRNELLRMMEADYQTGGPPLMNDASMDTTDAGQGVSSSPPSHLGPVQAFPSN